MNSSIVIKMNNLEVMLYCQLITKVDDILTIMENKMRNQMGDQMYFKFKDLINDQMHDLIK